MSVRFIAAVLVFVFGAAHAAEVKSFNIAAQPLAKALIAFSEQSNVAVMAPAPLVEGKTAPAVVGEMAPQKAIEKLLKGSGLTSTTDEKGTVLIRSATRATANADTQLRLAGMSQPDMQPAKEDGRTPEDASDSKGIPEILVKGARSANADIRRTEDDVQPYVVFDADEIERSMASDLETFLRTRLPMNQARSAETQSFTGLRGNQSSIDLRGLGPNQTLILVNGRRLLGMPSRNDFSQADINGIPLSAVERIEVLPSTAGGIYGGGATGGVVNVILKRDYNDVALGVRYDGTFAGGGVQRRVDLSAGFPLEGGRTRVMLTGSYRDGQSLDVGDRDFTARAWALQDQNDRAAFNANANPVHGYTTNIRAVGNAPLVLKAGMIPLNSLIAHVPVGYAGPASDNGAAFLGTAGRYNLTPANDLIGNQYSIVNVPEATALQLSVRREFTERIEAFVDLARFDNSSIRRGSRDVFQTANFTLPAGPNNPFTQAVRLSVPLVNFDSDRISFPVTSISEQLTGGFIVRLPGEWMAQGEYNYGRSENGYSLLQASINADGLAALIDGRLNPLRDVNANPLDFSPFYPAPDKTRSLTDKLPATQKNALLRVSGPLLRLPAGPLRLAALLERREQLTGQRVATVVAAETGAISAAYFPPQGSITDSAYAEFTAPLVAAANARPGIQGLELLASYRRDKTDTQTRPFSQVAITIPSPDGPFPDVPFQINSVTGNQYTLGLRYSPVENVKVRVSYGEGILPPRPSQLSELYNNPQGLASLRDPKRGNLPVDISVVEQYSAIGSMVLRPEQSASWSGGVIFTPAIVPGLRLSLDYTRIEKTDEISNLLGQQLLDLEDSFPDNILREPLSQTDAALGYTGGRIRIFKVGAVNIAHSLVEAVDVKADYAWQTPIGAFAANLIATVQPTFQRQAAPGGEVVDNVGYLSGPLKLRLNGGLRFSRGAWDLGWNMQYYDAYRIYTATSSLTSRPALVRGQGSEWIPTQTYHDVYGRYRFGNTGGFLGSLLENSDVLVSIQNVLNTEPPILATISIYPTAGYATEGDPRLRRYGISFNKRFGR